MKKDKNSKYHFDLYKPYVIHQNKAIPIGYLFLSIILLIIGIFEKQCNLWIIDLSIISAAYAYYSIQNKNEIIQIDRLGITTDETGLIEWGEIQRCFYCSSIGQSPTHWLKIIMKNGETRLITFNSYSYKG